ncbi:STAS domain-containing protein [Mycolicibacterium pulveris]|uniref:STAS domain-containing protein n=1 Tax=Mycolicibacterium pulveris TaxID=36813 RepID=UPI003CFB9B13
MTKAQFRVTGADAEQSPVVVATGEIDLANIDEFGAVLARAARADPAITVDLVAVSYCDSAALRELFSVATRTKLTLLVPAEGPITTLLEISGLDQVATVQVVG